MAVNERSSDFFFSGEPRLPGTSSKWARGQSDAKPFSASPHRRRSNGELRSNPNPAAPPARRLPIAVALVAEAVEAGGASQLAQPMVASARRHGTVAGRRRRRPLPRLLARQRPHLSQAGLLFLCDSWAPRCLTISLCGVGCQGHAGDGFGGAQGHAGDPG